MTAATDVPTQVRYGKVVGRFVEYLADTADAGDVPDERPLTGEITLTPLTTLTRWATTTPPRMAVPQKVICRVLAGDLCPPDSNQPGVWVVATNQPEGQPTTIQWKASFRFNGVLPQPADVVFNVPDGGVVDLALVVTIPAAPPTIVVVSHADAAAAAASADEAAQSAEDAAGAAAAAVANKVDKDSRTANVKDFGAVGDGVTNDAAAFDALVAWLNTNGSTSGVALTANIPAGMYNVKAGGIRALLVSNITIRCDAAAIFWLQSGPVWTLGNASTFVENIWVEGGQPRTKDADTLAATCAWVYGVNCARIYLDNASFTRCQIFKGVSTTTLSAIHISDFSGSGPIDRHWVEIDTSGNPNSAAAGLYLVNGAGYAYAPPVNPAISPKAVTAATQSNPVSVTCAGHGYNTGDRVRHGGVVGMTQLNGVDATVTVVNANTYTLDGVNGSGFGAYTSGGWTAELLWSYPYETAVVGIKGHWDTAVIRGGLYQHWPWLWSIESQGTVSFLFDEEVTWDYGGKGRFDIILNGGSISNVKVNGGWHFCLNEDWLRIAAPGAGSVTDITVRGHILGMTGGHFIYDSGNKILNLEVDGLRVLGVGRARVGTCYLVRSGGTGNNTATIRRVRCESAGTYYTNGATYLRPDVGLKVIANTRYTVTDNEIDAVTTAYDVSPTDLSGNRQRLVKNNKCRSGTLPEYLTTALGTPPASTVAAFNYTGLTKTIYLRGGTMTDVVKNNVQILSGAGPFAFDVMPGESWSVTYSAAPTMVVSYRDV